MRCPHFSANRLLLTGAVDGRLDRRAGNGEVGIRPSASNCPGAGIPVSNSGGMRPPAERGEREPPREPSPAPRDPPRPSSIPFVKFLSQLATFTMS